MRNTGIPGRSGPPEDPAVLPALDHVPALARPYEPGPVWMRVVPSLLLLGLGLWRITGPSYWRDEAATLTAVDRSLGQLLRMLGHVDAVHGVYYLVMWPVVRVAGPGEVATRLPSVLAMAVAAGMVAALGRRLASPEAGLAAGLVFAVAPQISRYAQDARSYGLIVALATSASYLLIRASATTGPRRGWLAGYAACLGLMGALDVFTLLLITAHAVTVALAGPRADYGRAGRSLWTAWLAAVTAAVLLASPILVLGYDQRGTLSWLTAKTQGLHALAGLWRMAGPPPMVLAEVLAVAGGLILAARAGRAGLRAAWPGPLLELSLPWLALPAMILISVSFISPVFTPRYVLYCLPALALLTGAGLAAAGRALRAPGWITVAAVLAIIALLGLGNQIAVRAAGGHGDNIRRLDQIVAARRQPGDAVIYRRSAARHLPAAYPYGLAQLDNIAQAKTAAQAGNLAGTVVPGAVLRRRLARVSRVWLVSAAGYPSGSALRGLGFRRVRAWRAEAMWLVLYRRTER